MVNRPIPTRHLDRGVRLQRPSSIGNCCQNVRPLTFFKDNPTRTQNLAGNRDHRKIRKPGEKDNRLRIGEVFLQALVNDVVNVGNRFSIRLDSPQHRNGEATGQINLSDR